MKEILDRLTELSDEKNRDFQARIVRLPPEQLLGVRTPALRKLAKELLRDKSGSGTAGEFMRELPHELFDEYQLHVMMISGLKDYDRALAETDRILPYIGNWATCDQLRPACFKTNRDKLIDEIYRWLDSEHTYTVRFAIVMLLVHYLGKDFKPEYAEAVCRVTSGEYYLKMAVAWYFAEALALQYDTAVLYIEQRRLPEWTHNKAIQKACESLRISDDTKRYLRSLKR